MYGKPFYAIKCMVGWLGYTMLRMCDGCKDVRDTDQDGSSVSTKWGNTGLRSPHFVLTEHTLVRTPCMHSIIVCILENIQYK